MIIYEGEKYACLNCIRGHRSSTCKHRDRPLILVRKRGRPNSAKDSNQRIALIADNDPKLGGPLNPNGGHIMSCKCTADGDTCGCGGNGPREVPDVIKIDSGTKQLVNMAEATTEKVEPVDSGFMSPTPAPSQKRARLRVKRRISDSAGGDEAEYKPVFTNNTTNGHHQGNGDAGLGPLSIPGAVNGIVFTETVPEVFIPVGNGLYRKASEMGMATAATTPSCSSGSAPSTTHTCAALAASAAQRNNNHANALPHAPLIIAPMSMEGLELSELDNNGLTNDGGPIDTEFDWDIAPELQDMLGSKDPSQDVLYTATCALGQCDCGPSCACEGCLEHDVKVQVHA